MGQALGLSKPVPNVRFIFHPPRSALLSHLPLFHLQQPPNEYRLDSSWTCLLFFRLHVIALHLTTFQMSFLNSYHRNSKTSLKASVIIENLDPPGFVAILSTFCNSDIVLYKKCWAHFLISLNDHRRSGASLLNYSAGAQKKCATCINVPTIHFKIERAQS